MTGSADESPTAETQLPFLCREMAGIGGVLKDEVDDFVVEEIPAYEPCGSGDHLFLWVRKRDTSAEWLMRHVSQRLGVDSRQIGCAGLKDRRGVTCQYISVPASAEGSVGRIGDGNIEVLHAARHRHKLRTGHSRGNRFTILLRDVVHDSFPRAAAIARRLEGEGVANYFGPQRFGRGNETLQLGRSLLSGTTSPGSLPRQRRRYLLRLALSAAQADLFNCLLADRIRHGTHSRVLWGDVLQVVASGGPFVSTDAARDQRRLEDGEVVITGAIYGRKMVLPRGEPAQRELAVVRESGLKIEDFDRFKRLTAGTRRPYLVFPPRIEVSARPSGLEFRFQLPRGAYATAVMREFMRLPL